MRKIYHLATCSTCKRILQSLPALETCILQDIKTESITPAQLDGMHRLSGSYESLFSRKAMKFRAMGLHEKVLTEADYRNLILQEYTFLKRPVMLIDGNIFIGNQQKIVEEAKVALSK